MKERNRKKLIALVEESTPQPYEVYSDVLTFLLSPSYQIGLDLAEVVVGLFLHHAYTRH